MALDNAQFISELSITDPPGTDPLSEGDDQIRTAKRAVFQSFEFIDKAVLLTADELNNLIDAAITDESNTFTATQTFTNATEFTRAADTNIIQLRYRDENLVDRWDMLMRPAADNDNWCLQRRGPTGTFIDFAVQVDATTGIWEFSKELKADNGNAATPAYGFSVDTGLGMYRDSANGLGFAAAGSRQMFLGATSLLLKSGVRMTIFNSNLVRKSTTTQVAGWNFQDASAFNRWTLTVSTDANLSDLILARFDASGVGQGNLMRWKSTGVINLPGIPTSNAGLVTGDLYAPAGFVQIVP